MIIRLLILLAIYVGDVKGEEIWFSITTNHREDITQGNEVISVERCIVKDRMVFSEKVITPNLTREIVHLNGETFHRHNYGKWIRGDSTPDDIKVMYNSARRYIFLEESFLRESQRKTSDQNFAERVETFVARQEQEKSALDWDGFYYEAFQGAITFFREERKNSHITSVQIANFRIDVFPYSDLSEAKVVPAQ